MIQTNRVNLGAYIPIVGCSISLIVLIVVAYIDRRSETPRDWFHRAGTCTFGAALLTCIANHLQLMI